MIKVAVPVPLRKLFDYLPPEDARKLEVGMRVEVPFGQRSLIGLVWSIDENTPSGKYSLKPITAVLDETPVIDPALKKLCGWLSDYYHHPIGEVCKTVLPNWTKKTIPLKKASEVKTQKASIHTLQLNEPQKNAVASVEKSFGQFHCFLLEGVTGSGKTEIYLRLIEKLITQDKQALILVPEISLTPQTIERFETRFPGQCVTLHSGLTNKKRLESWLQAKENLAKVIIGTRSAIFTSMKSPGIIIIDEEHDLSFKQQEGLRYSARDVAVMRGQFENIPILLGSATPALESVFNVEKKRYSQLNLPNRAGKATLPTYERIDLRDQYLESGLSEKLKTTIKKHLEQNNQVLLFLNRRGYAPVLMCQHCGWVGKCPRCEINYTYHQFDRSLVCHHCQKMIKNIQRCADCQQETLSPIGEGTERIEQALNQLFPNIPVLRIDRDTVKKKNQLTELLEKIKKGGAQILIGTQMLAKGHHFPNVTLVGIINPDYGFFSSDFRAMERMGQLILQVSGRAGREEKPGHVIIQTHQPEHPLLLKLIREGYPAFAKSILQERLASQLPPTVYFILIRAEANQLEKTLNFLQKIKELLKNKKNSAEIKIQGPVPSPMPKRAGRYRAQLLLSAKQRKHLHNVLAETLTEIQQEKTSRSVRWSIDIDPQEMI